MEVGVHGVPAGQRRGDAVYGLLLLPLDLPLRAALLLAIRLYQLTAMARPPDRAEAQKFLDSFTLTGPTRP